MSKQTICLGAVAILIIAAPPITVIVLMMQILLEESFASAGLLTLTVRTPQFPYS
jgi:hypothetical protein